MRKRFFFQIENTNVNQKTEYFKNEQANTKKLYKKLCIEKIHKRSKGKNKVKTNHNTFLIYEATQDKV